MTNRFCICVFWEKDGIVRDYVEYYLKGLQEIANKVLIVVNGEINAEGKKKLQALGVDIMQRPNLGLDFGGWKDAIAKIGYDELSKYDELILTNTTCYGPIYPLSEMFEEMKSKNCDFWGITKHSLSVETKSKKNKNVHNAEFIQSYFTVFKRNVIKSKIFKDYWENVDVNLSVDNEILQTDCLEKSGFISDSYVDGVLHKNFVNNPYFGFDNILKKINVPIIKKEVIVPKYSENVSHRLTFQNNWVLEFIKNNTEYDVSMIYDDIVATCTMSQIKSNLHLNYVMPYDYSYSNDTIKSKVALILYIYYEDLVEYCFNYAKSMPKGSDIYIVSSKDSTIEESKNKAHILDGFNLIYRLKENRGRDVSAYLVACADVFKNYDLVCCVHDKKSPHGIESRGGDFQYQCFECNLKSSKYVENIINLFECNGKLGLLCPPAPAFDSYVAIHAPISVNYGELKKVYNLLNLIIPFDENPVAPFGSMFWIRGKAIEPLFRHEWLYSDFPEEPLPIDGTISHAIERIYPYVAQEAGYLSGWIMPNDFASIYIDNLCQKIPRRELDITEVKKNNLLEQIFSLKNTYDKKHKIITILGVKLKFKRDKRSK